MGLFFLMTGVGGAIGVFFVFSFWGLEDTTVAVFVGVDDGDNVSDGMGEAVNVLVEEINVMVTGIVLTAVEVGVIKKDD